MGSSAQPESMAQMIQMISSLGDLQLRKRQLDQSQAQFKQSIALEAQRLGFDENDKRFNSVIKTMEQLASLPADTRELYTKLAGMTGNLPAGAPDILAQIGLKMPETAQTIRDRLAGQGVDAMSLTDRAALAQGTATSAMTGQNPGQMSQAQVLQMIADRAKAQLGAPAQPGQPSMLDASATGMLGGMTQPMAGATSYAGAMTPGMPFTAASNQAGTGVPATSQLSNKAELLRIQAELDIAQGQQHLALAQLARRQGLDPQEAVTALNTASDILKKGMDPSNKPAIRAAYISIYNATIKRVDPTGSEGLLITDPSAATQTTAVQQKLNSLGIGGTPTMQAPPGMTPGQVIQGVMPGGGAPMQGYQQPAYPGAVLPPPTSPTPRPPSPF